MKTLWENIYSWQFQKFYGFGAKLSAEFLIDNKPFHVQIAFKRSTLTFHIQTKLKFHVQKLNLFKVRST